MSRKYTRKLWSRVQNGELSFETVLSSCLDYMTEDEVKEMSISEEFIEDDEE